MYIKVIVVILYRSIFYNFVLNHEKKIADITIDV